MFRQSTRRASQRYGQVIYSRICLGSLLEELARDMARLSTVEYVQVVYQKNQLEIWVDYLHIICLGSLLEELARDMAMLSTVEYVQVVYQKNQLEIWLGYPQQNMFRQSTRRTSQRYGQIIYSRICLGSLLEELARDMGRLTHLQCVKCQSIFSQELEAGRRRKNKLEVKSQKKMQLW